MGAVPDNTTISATENATRGNRQIFRIISRAIISPYKPHIGTNIKYLFEISKTRFLKTDEFILPGSRHNGVMLCAVNNSA